MAIEAQAQHGLDFDQFFRDEFGALHRYVHRRLGRELADEIAAHSFAEAFAHWSRVRPDSDPRPWLYGIAANLIRAHWRREERQLRAFSRSGVDAITVDDVEAIAEHADAMRETRALGAALARLSPDEREVLLLCAWSEFSDTQIAAALNVPLGTVKSRLHRARQRMAAHLRRTAIFDKEPRR